MAGYIGSKASVTQVDGYNTTEADAEFLNQTEGDARYVELAGDTLTGALTGTDLTLSGGVYLGGTGSANKLDDYETGTWTPVVIATAANPTVSYLDQDGVYAKVGNLVVAWCDVKIGSISGGSGISGIGGLPFTISSHIANRANHGILLDNLTSDYRQVSIQGNQSSNYTLFIQGGGKTSSHGGFSPAGLSANTHIRFCINYYTSA
jgi:hypothetical protein